MPRATSLRTETTLLLLTGAFLLLAAVTHAYQASASAGFGATSFLRLALVCGALWLAWPSLRRPAQWLPSGIVLIALVAIGVVAFQPRLAVFVIPAVSALVTAAAVVRLVRPPGRS